MNRLLSLSLILGAGCSTGTDLSTASSAISLDTTTGIGFVGKGAVQSRFGWNNAGLQANVGGITFSFEVSGVYQQSCVHQANKKDVQVTFKKTVELSSAVDYMARRNPLQSRCDTRRVAHCVRAPGDQEEWHGQAAQFAVAEEGLGATAGRTHRR